MSQDTSGNPHDMTRQTPATWALDVESRGQDTEYRLHTMAHAPQRPTSRLGPLLFLVGSTQGQQLDAAFAPQAFFEFRVVVGFVGDQDQVSAVQYQGVQHLDVMFGSGSQQ